MKPILRGKDFMVPMVMIECVHVDGDTVLVYYAGKYVELEGDIELAERIILAWQMNETLEI